MILQERIEELNSGIIILQNNSKVNLIGFLSEERLLDYYNKKLQCFFSNGIYDFEELDFSKIKDNALFIVIKNNKEIQKHKYIVLKKDIVKLSYRNENNVLKYTTKTFKIRKNIFTKQYNYIDSDYNVSFDNASDLKNYFFSRFNTHLTLEVQECSI